MRARTRWIAGLSAAAILLTTVGTVSGYTGQVEAIASVAVRGTVTCDKPFTLAATFLDATGAPVKGLSVAWSFVTSPSSADRINRTPTKTNAKGVATTTVTLAPVNGERKVRATTSEASASVVVTAVCGGLPRTDTLPAGEPSGTGVLGILMLALGAMAGAALALRRTA